MGVTVADHFAQYVLPRNGVNANFRPLVRSGVQFGLL